MKATIAWTLGLSLTLGTLAAQDCPLKGAQECQGQSATACQGKVAEIAECSQGNKVTIAFNKLTKEQQKVVSEAFVNVVKSCPVGSKVPHTVVALDRLYTDALTSLKKIAKSEALPEALRADATKTARMIARLSNANKDSMATMKLLASGAGKSECGDCNGQDCQDCKDCKDCCQEAKGCSISLAADLTTKWGSAMSEFQKVSKCEKTMASMTKNFEVLKSHKIDVQDFVTANLRMQLATLDENCGKIACSKSGLIARNKELCDACSFTNENLTKSVNSIVAAHKLLTAVPFLAKKEGECSETKGECPASSKTECSKTECSKTKVKQ